jgi:hypothetical protein
MSEDAPLPEKITLTPWARVEGVLRADGRGVPNEGISLLTESTPEQFSDKLHIYAFSELTTGAQGEFVFERVFPGKGWVGPVLARVDAQAAPKAESVLRLETQFIAGETTWINLGDEGRTVIGKLELPEKWRDQVKWKNVYLSGEYLPPAPEPAATDSAPKDAAAKFFFQATVDSTGGFRFQGLRPGKYEMNFSLGYDMQRAAEKVSFTVPDADAKEPLDLGTLLIKSAGDE